MLVTYAPLESDGSCCISMHEYIPRNQGQFWDKKLKGALEQGAEVDYRGRGGGWLGNLENS